MLVISIVDVSGVHVCPLAELLVKVIIVVLVFTGVCSKDTPEDKNILMKLGIVIVLLSSWGRVIFHVRKVPMAMVHITSSRSLSQTATLPEGDITTSSVNIPIKVLALVSLIISITYAYLHIS